MGPEPPGTAAPGRRAGQEGCDVAAHVRPPVPPAEWNHAASMADPPAPACRAEDAREYRRERGSHRRSGRAADGGHAAPALQPRARNQSHGLSQALLDAGGKRSLTRPALIEASIVPSHMNIYNLMSIYFLFL